MLGKDCQGVGDHESAVNALALIALRYSLVEKCRGCWKRVIMRQPSQMLDFSWSRFLRDQKLVGCRVRYARLLRKWAPLTKESAFDEAACQLLVISYMVEKQLDSYLVAV